MKIYNIPGGVSLPNGNNFRLNIQYNSFWVATGYSWFGRVPFEELELYNPKNWEAHYEKYPDSTPHQVMSGSLWGKYQKIAIEQYGLNPPTLPTDVLGYGNVPTSATSFKSYILLQKAKEIEIWDSEFVWDTKTKGWKSKTSARFEKIGQWITDLGSNDFQKRAKAVDALEKLGELAKPALTKLLASKPSVEVRRRAQMILDEVNAKSEGLLEDADNYEKFPALFAEDFYFFLRKNDYYFVTESGKLYYAPPRKEGEKSRTMKELWVDAKRPIVAVIEDVDRTKVWLFAKDKNAGAKRDFYFEMKDTIRAESFDPANLKAVNVEGRAKRLLEYLPLITADGRK